MRAVIDSPPPRCATWAGNGGETRGRRWRGPAAIGLRRMCIYDAVGTQLRGKSAEGYYLPAGAKYFTNASV